MPDQDGEPTLDDIQQQYPEWRCWVTPKGSYRARRTDAKPDDPVDETFVTAEDAMDLRDQIQRAQALTDW